MSKKILKKVNTSLTDYFWTSSKEDHNPLPLACPVCTVLLDGKKDVLSCKSFGCCRSCANVFVYPNKEEWEKGWRPDKNQISAQREKRMSVPTYIL